MNKSFVLILFFLISNVLVSYERPILVVIPSYNNELWCEKNLDSLFSQKYENYRVIYIDDCSTDNTYHLVHDYVAKNNQAHRVTLIKNDRQRGALANHFYAVHSCRDHEIIVQLDGDDWFAHDHVLSCVNDAYADLNVWMTYGQFQVYPTNKHGQCESIPEGVLKKRAYREYKWVTSALRTFYAGLFKQIKLQDLIDDGDFFQVTGDLACMLPMLEMAHGRVKCIEDVLYIYNCKTAYNDHKKHLQQQRHAKYVIRARKKYEPLSFLPFKRDVACQTFKADMIIFSNHPQRLRTLLTSFYGAVSGVDTVTVVYSPTNSSEYDFLKQEFPLIKWRAVDKHTSVSSVLARVIHNVDHEYFLVAHDSCVIVDFIDIALCIAWMKRTHAYAFFLSLGKNITYNPLLIRDQKKPSFIRLGNDDVCAWQFKHGEYDWSAGHNVNMTLYAISDLKSSWEDLNIDSLDTFEWAWCTCTVDPDAVGLCFEQSKVVQVITNEAVDPTSYFGVYNNSIQLTDR